MAGAVCENDLSGSGINHAYINSGVVAYFADLDVFAAAAGLTLSIFGNCSGYNIFDTYYFAYSCSG